MAKTHTNNFFFALLIWLSINLAGLVSQFFWGSFPFQLMAFPVHAYLFLLVLILSLIFGFISNSLAGKHLGSYQSALVSIGGLCLWAVVLGFTAQSNSHAPAGDFAGKLGIRHMSRFFPFVLSYLYLMICLSFAIARRLRQKISVRNIGFMLNHAGLLFTLYFIGAGAADTKQYSLTVREGSTEWRGTNKATNTIAELPVAIHLHDFVMEEYLPKLAIVHRKTGQVQPEKRPEYLDIDTLNPNGKLLGYDICIKKYLTHAVRNSDSTYREIKMPGACPAACVEVENQQTGNISKSWVSAGNHMQLYKFMPLGKAQDSLVLVMTQPEAKAFYSDLDFFMKSGKSYKNKRIQVNHPLMAGHWAVYQSDYDEALGTASVTSVFDLVFDPWRRYSIASILMLATGALFLFWRVQPHQNTKQ